MIDAPSRPTRILTGLATGLLVASVLFGGFLLAGAVVGFGPSGHEVGVHTRVPANRVVDLPPGAIAPQEVDVIVRVRHASAAQVRWLAARDLAPGSLVVLALALLRAILVSVRDGDAFTNANVRRLVALAVTVLLGAPFAMFISSICANELATSAGLPAPGTVLTMPGGALLGGLVLLVLAEVFATGVRLRDDVEGMV